MADPLMLELAWTLGRESVLEARAEFWDDSLHVPPDPPRLSHEERVRLRVAEFERCADAIADQMKAEAAGAPRGPWRCA